MDYLEFIARVTSHVPDKGQVMIRYYGLCKALHKPYYAPFRLPSSDTGRLVVKFPNGGTIYFPNAPRANSEASMDPLPGFPTNRASFIVEGNSASIHSEE
jgi:hypothetical protein